jgi:hypothetical protein
MLLIPLVNLGLGWRGLWQANAVILIAYALWVKRETAHLPGGEHAPDRRRKLRQDLLLTLTSGGPVLLSIFAAYALQWLAVMSFLPFAGREYGLSPGRASC